MPHSHLASLDPGIQSGLINDIHHQAIRDLAPGFRVEARCPHDGVIEALRSERPGYITAVQWHPEFRSQTSAVAFNDTPILPDFLAHARAYKATQQ